MHKNLLNLGLAGILFLSSGCSLFRSVDRGLTKFADALAEHQRRREESRPEFILKKRGYFIYLGNVTVPPVQNSIITNVTKITTFSYTSQEAIDALYLTLSKEFKDILGHPYYEERQKVFPAGFSSLANTNGSVTYSYRFSSETLEKGLYRYEWWLGAPPESNPNIFESFADFFMRNESEILMEGIYDHK